MSLETLLTLALAAALLGVAIVVRLIVSLVVRSIRWARGENPRRRRRFAEEVARRGWIERVKPRIGRLGQGAAALVVFVVATLVSGLRALGRWVSGWWRNAARPSLEEAQTAGFALLTVEPEASRDVAVLERVASTLDGNGTGSPERRDAADFHLV